MYTRIAGSAEFKLPLAAIETVYSKLSKAFAAISESIKGMCDKHIIILNQTVHSRIMNLQKGVGIHLYNKQ